MGLRHVAAGAAIVLAAFVVTANSADAPADAALKAAVADKSRTAENAPRDIYRHPSDTLAFWGLKPKQTIIEIEPGGGYWTEILVPYTKTTGGRFVATLPDETDPKMPEGARKFFSAFKARFPGASWVDWRADNTIPMGPPASADMVIVARLFHDFMWEPGQMDKVLKDCLTVLKPGGILAVEDHRADPRPQVPDAHDGYVNTKVLIAAIEKAGFKFEASSEVNANPKDTKDYPFGVWSLPPTNAKSFPEFTKTWPGRPTDAPLDPAKAKTIGESDRMTLRFRKPG